MAFEPPRMIGTSRAIQQVRSLIAAVAPRDCTVLIHGESGTGKELVARQIHAAGPRAGGPFVAVDCTTLPDTLFESQLFGHVKGAFTGAEQDTLGFLRSAHGGTVLLDEIGDLSPPLQAKFLRFLQDRTVIPLGGLRPIPINVRVLAATHQDLPKKVGLGEFRADLFYRLHVVNLTVPPLRNRNEDIENLSRHFLKRQIDFYGESRAMSISDGALRALKSYTWPGNVRELANVIEHGFVLSNGAEICEAQLPSAVRIATTEIDRPDDESIVPLETAERQLIARALRATGGHQARTARILEIERRRLYRMIRRHGLESYVKTRRSSAAS